MKNTVSTSSCDSSTDDAAVRVLRQFRQVFNAVKTHFRQVEKTVGLGGAQVWALSLIRDMPGVGIGDLAQAMNIHQSTTSNLVKGLVERELVLFSATTNQDVLTIAWKYQNDPVEVRIEATKENRPQITQYVINTEREQKYENLLYLLASHPGRVFDREQILSRIWGYDFFGDTRTVDTHIKRLRQKLSCDEMGQKWDIITVYGVGYKFEAEA